MPPTSPSLTRPSSRTFTESTACCLPHAPSLRRSSHLQPKQTKSQSRPPAPAHTIPSDSTNLAIADLITAISNRPAKHHKDNVIVNSPALQPILFSYPGGSTAGAIVTVFNNTYPSITPSDFQRLWHPHHLGLSFSNLSHPIERSQVLVIKTICPENVRTNRTA